jgi:chaperonin cofactor prefoldin
VAYLAAAKDSAVVTKMQSELEQRDAKIAMMEKQMAEINARFEDMARKVNA